MDATHEIYNKISTVLDSDLSTYRIAKEMGFVGQSYIANLRNGVSRIENITLDRAERFEMVYNKYFL